MAPEMSKETPYEGPPVDIFSLGVTLYIMLIHSFPFLKAKDRYHRLLYSDPSVLLAKTKKGKIDPDAL